MEKSGITITVGAPGETGTGSTISKYGVGRKYRGKVVNFKPYGFFVETEDGGFGLVHGRNVKGWNWKLRFDRVFKFGSEVEVTVIDIENETNRMSFSCEMPKVIPEDSAIERPAPTRALAPAPVAKQPVSVAKPADAVSSLPSMPSQNMDDEDLECVDDDVRQGSRFGALADRLNRKAVFPSSKWIDYYRNMSSGLLRGKGIFGVSDTVERLAIPMLGQLGWDVSVGNAALVRGSEQTFNIQIYGGKASSGEVSIAIKCAMPGENFALLRGVDDPTRESERDVVEQTLGLYNRLRKGDPTATKIAWTNGIDWVVFRPTLLAECIGVLAEHRGRSLMDGMDEKYFARITFPVSGEPFEWLAAFADLHDVLGK